MSEFLTATFFFKLTLAPLLVVVATLLGRRFGPRITGWIAGFPIVAGPVLLFYALEQGPLYAAAAAKATIEGLISLSVFALAYAWRGFFGKEGGEASPLACVVAGWTGFAVMTFLLQSVQVSLGKTLVWSLSALFLVGHSLPKSGAPRVATAPNRWDLPARVLATVSLVLGLTALAHYVGPRLAGLLTPFPVASTILTVFAQRQGGIASATAVLKGLIAGLNSFAGFCAVLALGLPLWPIWMAFAAALGTAVLIQTALYIALLKFERHEP